jgi:demethoxyubiquinone hydroxylase (CLK1/Coq7/Cat5 family)
LKKAICSLNFMYSMERFATAVYRVQKSGFTNKAILEKMVYAEENERQHSQKLKERIIELKHKPFILAFLFQIAGCLVGSFSRCFSKTLALKTDTVIENRAVKDYSYFLRTLEFDDKTKQMIRDIISDEELHIKNWQTSIKLIGSKD